MSQYISHKNHLSFQSKTSRLFIYGYFEIKNSLYQDPIPADKNGSSKGNHPTLLTKQKIHCKMVKYTSTNIKNPHQDSNPRPTNFDQSFRSYFISCSLKSETTITSSKIAKRLHIQQSRFAMAPRTELRYQDHLRLVL